MILLPIVILSSHGVNDVCGCYAELTEFNSRHSRNIRKKEK